MGTSLLIMHVLMIKRVFLSPCAESNRLQLSLSVLREAAWSLLTVSACYYVQLYRHAA